MGLNQTLCYLITVKQALARLESSSLHLRGVEPIHCHLKITRPCLDSTYDSSNKLPLPLTSTPASPSPKGPPPLKFNDGYIESSNLPLTKSEKKSKNLLYAKGLPLTIHHTRPLLLLYHFLFQSALALHVFRLLYLNIIKPLLTHHAHSCNNFTQHWSQKTTVEFLCEAGF